MLSSRVEEFSRPGIDGSGFRILAKRAPVSQKQTVAAVATLADANAAADAYDALKGSLVTVVDDLGRTNNNVMVIDVQVGSPRSVLKSVPTGINYLVDAIWTLKSTV